MFINMLSKQELLLVAKEYNSYVVEGLIENNSKDWNPVCINEFLNNEYKEIKEEAIKTIKNEFNVKDDKAKEILDLITKTRCISLNSLKQFLETKDIGKMSLKDGKNVFKREFYNQGSIFKSYKNFFLKDKICYVPELSDTAYTRDDFMAIARNPHIAFLLFELVDWQHPESLLDDLLSNGELIECPKCKSITALYDFEEYGLDVICEICDNKFKVED